MTSRWTDRPEAPDVIEYRVVRMATADPLRRCVLVGDARRFLRRLDELGVDDDETMTPDFEIRIPIRREGDG